MQEKNTSKKKFLIIGIIVILALIVGGIVWALISKDEIPEIKAKDVARIYYDDFTENGEKELDIDQFLTYYNQIHDVKNNKKGEGTTSESRIVIELKNGKEIGIYNQSKKFEINFQDDEGKNQQYWGMQEEILNMLKYGAYEGEK